MSQETAKSYEPRRNFQKKVSYVDYCWQLNNASSYDLQAHGSVVAFPLEYSPRLINPWNKRIAMLN
jgi:hypothetical protein